MNVIFDNIVSKKDEVQNMNNNQLKFEIHDIYENDEKLTTTFKAVNDSDVKNKAYVDKNLSKIDAHLSFLIKDYNEFEILSN